MISPLRDAVYSYRNAEDVVIKFIRKYARVVLFVCKICHVEIETFQSRLIFLYMYKNAEWNVARDTLKRINVSEDMEYLAKLSVDDRKIYIRMLSSLVADWLFDHGINAFPSKEY